VRIGTAVAGALDYAHKKGLLHRDVKPANIMLSHLDDEGEQRVLLADFGIARAVDDISGLATTNMTVGTVAYSAPESHELVLLESAARTADLIADLQSLIDEEGLVLGGRTHPGVAEIRQQRLVLARLMAALRMPTGDEDDRPSRQRRSIRGVYRLYARAS